MEEEKLVLGDLVSVVGGPQWSGAKGIYHGCDKRLVAIYIEARAPKDEDVVAWVRRCYVERVYRLGEEYRGSVYDFYME
jgi:hypothetical protein